MSDITPQADYVVLEQDKPEVKTQSGLYLPTDSQQVTNSGTAVAVGANVKDVAVGDKVIFKNPDITGIKVGDKDYLIVSNENVIAKIS